MKLKMIVVDLEIPPRIRKWGIRLGIPLGAVLVGGAVALAAGDAGAGGSGLITWSSGEVLQAASLNANFASLQSEIASVVPPGTIAAYGGPQLGGTNAGAVPPGWLLCDGAAVSRTTYSNLFGAIGINFGSGDGVATFNLPDLRGRTLIGAGDGPGLTPRTIGQALGEESHVLSVNEMPSHGHTMYPQGAGNQPGQPFLYGPGNTCGIQCSPNSGFVGAFGGGSTAATGGGAAHNVMQPSAVINYVIHM